jgi:hypothetical protein
MRNLMTLVCAATALVASLQVGGAQSAAGVKKPICGLVTMGDLGFLRGGSKPTNSFNEANRHPDMYAGVVILAQWRDLEPERGKFDFKTIDNALANVKKYNAAHPKNPIVGKLRVFAAAGTPEWATKIDGGPVKVVDKRGINDLGKFWGKPYGDAWRELQVALAAKYDGDPLMGEVAVSSCSSTTAEPFIIFLTPENLPVLHAAGFTDAAMKGCLKGAIDDYSVWKKTPIDYTFNEFRDSDSGKAVVNPAFLIEVMEAFRAKYGMRGVVANHGLQTDLKPAATRTYAEFEKLGPPIEFQTISPVLDWNGAVAKGLTYHPTEIETWNSRDAGGASNYTAADLVNWKAEIGCVAK